VTKPTCEGPECTRTAAKRKYCGGHYEQWRRWGNVWKFGEAPHRRPKATCTFDPCGRPNFAHGLCSGHDRQKRRGIELRPIRPPKPVAEEGYSWCGRCKTFPPVENFGWDATRNQIRRTCLDCHSAEQREWRARNAGRARGYRIYQKYGITPEQYHEMWDDQDGMCRICDVELPNVLVDDGDMRSRSAVDHDHGTGKVRGLLCAPCNCAIGYMRDNPERLEAAARYLRDAAVTGV
jgi:hypothetical protein